MVSGPLATMLLADQGADVIKVENPAGGDYTRAVSNRRGGFSASFLNNNRNKRSVAIDLKRKPGVGVLHDLLRTADVLIQNFRPGVADRMGIGEDQARALAPTIIYVSINGFGDQGPYAAKPVYDPLVQALSGLATVQAGSDDLRPRLVRTILPDKLTAITCAQAVTSALLSRERTGEGQHVRLSMLDSVIAFLWGSDMGSQTFVDGDIPQQQAQSFIDLIYQTADGYISVAVQSDKEWEGLARAFDKPEWLSDERFSSAALRHTNINDRLSMTQEVLLSNTTRYWLDRLNAEDVPCAPVLNRWEVLQHPQVVRNRITMETDHPQAGKLRQARPAARFSKTPTTVRCGAPVLGQHTIEVLGEVGYSAAHIDELLANEVVVSGRVESQDD